MAGLEKDRNAVASTQNIDLKLEVVVIPVADVDRAREFYGSLGWRLDADFRFDNGFRIVQFTPPGSRCFDSIRHQDLVAGSRLSTKPLSRRS